MVWRGNVFWQPVARCTRHHNVKRTIYEKSNHQTIFKILESTLCQLIIRKKSAADFVHAPLWYSSFVFRPSPDMWWIMDVIIFAQVKNAYCNYPKPNGSLFHEWKGKEIIRTHFGPWGGVWRGAADGGVTHLTHQESCTLVTSALLRHVMCKSSSSPESTEQSQGPLYLQRRLWGWHQWSAAVNDGAAETSVTLNHAARSRTMRTAWGSLGKRPHCR